MTHHSGSDVPDFIVDRVRENNSPSLQICSDVSGRPVACNITASRFAINPVVRTWDDLVAQEDVDAWSQLIEDACLNHNACGGVFGLQRFDNAIRIFTLRAEPQFSPSGVLCCHLICGMDITDVLNQRHLPATGQEFDLRDADLRDAARSLHERLVSTATVVVSASDIIEGVAMNPDADQLLKVASEKLSSAATDLIEHLRTLSLTGRSNHRAN